MLVFAGCAPSGKLTVPVNDLQSTTQDPATRPPVSTQPPPGSDIKQPPLPPLTPPSNDPFDSLAEGPAKFDSPWKNPDTSIVIDAYQNNAIDWDRMATDSRMAAVIHRSSIGLATDTQYTARRKIAKARGYLWGAYHLGKSGDPIEQAKFFLKTIENDPETLMFLDLEDTSNSTMMNIPNAEKFMQYVFDQTGRVPVVYANHSVTKALNAALPSSAIFKSSRLWYARFRSDVPDFPKGIWSTFFLWQFSSEINCSKTGSCLYNVPGTAYDIDVNVFYGSKAALASQWH